MKSHLNDTLIKWYNGNLLEYQHQCGMPKFACEWTTPSAYEDIPINTYHLVLLCSVLVPGFSCCRQEAKCQ